MQAEQHMRAQDHQRQLEHVQKTAEANTERVRKRMEAEKAELQKTLEGNSERERKRMEAEIADLQSKADKLEADLKKVSSSSRPRSIGF